MCRVVIRASVGALLVPGCLAASVPAAQAALGCGRETGVGGPYYVLIERGTVSCRTARELGWVSRRPV